MKKTTTVRLAQWLEFIVVMTVIGLSFAACSDGDDPVDGKKGVAPAITTATTLPGGTVGTAYNQTLAATGDTPITWSLDGGNLPTGINLFGNGAIAGTPSVANTYTFTVKATNAAGSVTKPLSITITGGGTAPTIITTALDGGTVGVAYNQPLTATGTAPITWSLDSGDLPTGLDIVGSAIAGTPSVADTFTFTVKAANAAGSVTKPLSITIAFIEMIQIPAGTFTMGSPIDEPGRFTYQTFENEHQVTLTSGFSMGKYPVTQAQYEAVMGTNPSWFSSGNGGGGKVTGLDTAGFPVEWVSWYDALVFCNKLSVNEGLTPAYRISGSTDPAAWGTVPTTDNDEIWDAVEMVTGSTGYRLPTEAQWEYACRAGTTTAYNWGTDYIDDTKANYDARNVTDNNTVEGICLQRTSRVGSYAANAWGLYDMHGNLYEWCWDWYSSTYYSSSPVQDPMGAVSGEYREARGGGWGFYGRYLRSASNYGAHPGGRGDFGFRLVLPAQ